MKRLKRAITWILAAAMVFLLSGVMAGAAASPLGEERTAEPVSYFFFVDGGKGVTLSAYRIDGRDYFKLRDIAAVMAGSNREFSVGWDGDKNAVVLRTGQAYTPVGGELFHAEKSEAQSAQSLFFLDGVRFPIRGYLVNGANYVDLSDLAARLLVFSSCDRAGGVAQIETGGYYTGLYSLSLPAPWSASGFDAELTLLRSGMAVGSISSLGYDPALPISQFQGNHRETVSTGTVSGLSYPAAKAIIRAYPPAAAAEVSYTDELHIYLLLSDAESAVDLCFDSALVTETEALSIARAVAPNPSGFAMVRTAYAWAKAVRERDGQAQYKLLSAGMQEVCKPYYEGLNWVTGVSSPWIESYSVLLSDGCALVSYETATSTGFAGYYEDILTFTQEKGGWKIGGVTGWSDLPSK